jgi:hypothetical protein
MTRRARQLLHLLEDNVGLGDPATVNALIVAFNSEWLRSETEDEQQKTPKRKRAA